MKLLFRSVLAVILSCGTIQAQDIVGQWNGILSVYGTNLRLIFHIEKTDEGYTSTLDSPDQGATGFPVKTTSFDGSKLSLELLTLAAKYEGEFQIDSIVGTFTQNGMSFPMTLKKVLPIFCHRNPSHFMFYRKILFPKSKQLNFQMEKKRLPDYVFPKMDKLTLLLWQFTERGLIHI